MSDDHRIAADSASITLCPPSGLPTSSWPSENLSQHTRSFEGEAWRLVESQVVTSTRKLVESDAEHAVLEQLLEDSKPAIPTDADFSGLHYLLATSFRYPPLRHGSRFGKRTSRGIWYGSLSIPTALAEIAYYRLLFVEGSEADLGLIEARHTAYRTAIKTSSCIDLNQPPFDAFAELWTSKTDYRATQDLGERLSHAEIDMCRYRSARDRNAGDNVALFTAKPFAKRQPYSDMQQWYSATTRSSVEFCRINLLVRTKRQSYRFPRTDFEVEGVLPQPAP